MTTTAPMSPARRLRNIVGGSAGNLVEWFDWYAYAAFTLYFAPIFFPGDNPTAEYLQAAAQPEDHDGQGGADEEGDAPSPGRQGLFAERVLQHDKQQ